MLVMSTLITSAYLNDTTDSLQSKNAGLNRLVLLLGKQDKFQSVIKKLKSQEFGREPRRPKCVLSSVFLPVEHCPVHIFQNLFWRFLQKKQKKTHMAKGVKLCEAKWFGHNTLSWNNRFRGINMGFWVFPDSLVFDNVLF